MKSFFRADHVGGLLCPAALEQARMAYNAGELLQAELVALENQAIDTAIAMQELLGLRAIMDGEFRRAIYFGYFTNEQTKVRSASLIFRGADH